MQTINVNIIPSLPIGGGCEYAAASKIMASQGDVGRQFAINLFEDNAQYNIPQDAEIEILGKKSDGNIFQYNDNITFENNIVTITLKEQMSTTSGPVICELRIIKDENIIGTANFILHVEGGILDGTPSESTLDLISQVEEAVHDAQSAAEDAEEAAAEAIDVAQSIHDIAQEVEQVRQYAASAAQSAEDAQEAAEIAVEAAQSVHDITEQVEQARAAARAAASSAEEAAGYVDNAASYADNALASAQEAALSESNAATSESNASQSATDAANSATAAGNSASAASTSESNAASSANDASGYAATASQKATEAATSENNAAASALAASGSASAAATSETNAAASASQAAADLDKFENPTVQTITIAASAWNSSTHLATITVQGVTTTSAQEILPLLATSAANIANNTALQQAQLFDAGQAAGEITLYAGTVPSVDLKIRIIVR